MATSGKDEVGRVLPVSAVVPRAHASALGPFFASYLVDHSAGHRKLPSLQAMVLLAMLNSDEAWLQGSLFDLAFPLRAAALRALIDHGTVTAAGKVALPDSAAYVLRSDPELLDALDEFVAALKADLAVMEAAEATERAATGKSAAWTPAGKPALAQLPVPGDESLAHPSLYASGMFASTGAAGGGDASGESKPELDALSDVDLTCWPQRPASGYVTQVDLDRLRSFTHPPPFVDAICECICILLHRPVMFAQQVRHERHLLRYLDDIEPSTLTSRDLDRLRPYVRHPHFHNPELAQRVSESAAGLAALVVDIYKYARFAEHPQLSLVRHLYKRVYALQSQLLHVESVSYSHRYMGSAARGVDLFLSLDDSGSPRRIRRGGHGLPRSHCARTRHCSTVVGIR